MISGEGESLKEMTLGCATIVFAATGFIWWAYHILNTVVTYGNYLGVWSK